VLVPSLAEDLGVSQARTRAELCRGNWRTIARGAVLTRPEEPTRADWADLGIALGGPSAALSGWDAVRVLGLGTPRPPSDEVLVLSRHASNRVIGHVRIRETDRPYRLHLTSEYEREYPLTPVAQAARVVADASRYYRDPAPVCAIVTAAVQRKLCTIDELMTELRDGPRNGSRCLRLALHDATDGARSVAEATASRRMTRARIPAYELNVPVLDRSGRKLFEADALWRGIRAVLEIDSREHHFDEPDWEKTMKRHNRLTRHSLAVEHRPPKELCGRSSAWLDELREWLVARSAEVGVPLPRGHGVIRPPDGVPVPYYLE
jgi:hypothetical protein